MSEEVSTESLWNNAFHTCCGGQMDTTHACNGGDRTKHHCHRSSNYGTALRVLIFPILKRVHMYEEQNQGYSVEQNRRRWRRLRARLLSAKFFKEVWDLVRGKYGILNVLLPTRTNPSTGAIIPRNPEYRPPWPKHRPWHTDESAPATEYGQWINAQWLK